MLYIFNIFKCINMKLKHVVILVLLLGVDNQLYAQYEKQVKRLRITSSFLSVQVNLRKFIIVLQIAEDCQTVNHMLKK